LLAWLVPAIRRKAGTTADIIKRFGKVAA